MTVNKPGRVLEWWMERQGYTWYYNAINDRIYALDEYVDQHLLPHEMKHREQCRRDGRVKWIWRYYTQWVIGIVKRFRTHKWNDAVHLAYLSIDYEVEARRAESNSEFIV